VAGEDATIDLASRLEQVVTTLERFVALERARIKRGEHPKRVVLINSAASFWDAYVLTQLECSHTSPHLRVRRATVKPVPDKGYARTAPVELMRRQARWSVRRAGRPDLPVRAGSRIRIADLDDFGGFGDGWSRPDTFGLWTEGPRAELTISLGKSEKYTVLAIGVDGVCVEPGGSLTVDVLVEGELVSSRDFSAARSPVLPTLRQPPSPRLTHRAKAVLPNAVTRRLYPLFWRLFTPASLRPGVSHLRETVWRIELPPEVSSRRPVNLTFVFNRSRTAQPVLASGSSDGERELGIHIRSLRLEQPSRTLRKRDGFPLRSSRDQPVER
jgi:hypothetical protein